MEELVDRILNGDAVDITGTNATYYLSVVDKKVSGFKVGFVAPSGLDGQGSWQATRQRYS